MSEKELKPSPKFPNGEYPNLSPNPNTHDGLEDKTNEKPNTQVVTLPHEQEKSNLTVSEVIALIQKYAPGFDPSDVEAGTLISALGLNVDGALKKQALAGMFDGKYVRIMDAPSSTTLTDEQIAQIIDGVFIEGAFLGYKNPVLLPATQLTSENDDYVGTFIVGQEYYGQYEWRGCILGIYIISKNTKVISRMSTMPLYYAVGAAKWMLKGKAIPNYPADTAIGQLICRKGALEYYIPVAQDNITSGDTIALNSALGKALIDHLEVEINGYRARYEYTDGNYVVYSSKTEADSGLKLQVNMISYNTTNGELSFNQMTFTPDN